MADAKKNFSILLVDDDRFLIDMYSLKFKECGCEIQTATSAEDALKLLRGGLAPDIILLDVTMPGMTGFELLEVMRKENLAPDATVVVLSNQGQESDLARAKELGAEGYIVKASAIPSEVLDKTIAFAEKSPKRKGKG